MNINWYRLAKGTMGVIASSSTGAEQGPVWIGVHAGLWKELGKGVETAILTHLHSDRRCFDASRRDSCLFYGI